MWGKFSVSFLAGAMMVVNAGLAETPASEGTLPAGKAAGVKEAAFFQGQHHMLWIVAGGSVGLGVGLIMTGNGHGTVSGSTCPIAGCLPSSTTTTTTTTTPTTTTTRTSTTTTTTTKTSTSTTSTGTR